MIIQGLRWTHVRIPLARGFATAHGALASREGWIVRLVGEDGHVGIGEASPLHGHALPPGPPVESLLEKVQTSLPRPFEQLPVPVGASASEAAVRFAIETAGLDLIGQATGRPIAALLGVARGQVAVNAVIGAADDREAAAEAATAVAAGYRTVKLKVGGRPIAADVRRVERVRSAIGPAARLRLDANGAWTVKEAIEALEAMRPFELELIEQPAPAGRLDALRRVREASGLPIAADESVTSPAAAAALLASKAVDVLVLKPMVLGGLRVSLAIAQRAAREGVSCIVTTTIDTGVATAAALHLAAAIPGAPLANGLATAAFLASDLLVAPLPIEAGSMAVPAAPGLGVSVDDAALLRFAAQEQPV